MPLSEFLEKYENLKSLNSGDNAEQIYSAIKDLKLEATTIINRSRQVLLDQLARLDAVASFYEKMGEEVSEMYAPVVCSFKYNPAADIEELNCELQKAIEYYLLKSAENVTKKVNAALKTGS